MTSDPDSLYCLIHDFVTAEMEGLTTDQQRREFEELIKADPVAAELYVTYVQELSSLRWTFSNSPDELVEQSQKATPLHGAREAVETAEMSGPAFLRREKAFRLGRFALALAACLLIGLGWTVSQWFGLGNRPGQLTESDAIGLVVNLDEVQWSEGAARYQELAQIPLGERIRFDTGVLEVMLSSGAEITIEGPADVTLTSIKKAFVQKGKLVVRCGPDAVGFEIESPDAKVVDLGTVFGVSVVDSERTDVVVYDGTVDLKSAGVSKKVARRLTAGEAMHVSRHGAVGRIPVVPNDRLLLPRTLASSHSSRSALIKEVRDNLQASETAKYYRIVNGGFGEECPAFVDRDHQWNGNDQRGIPEFLLGGDYVMTFNDDKIRRVEIEVDLVAPASLYLLLDNRLSIPDWVKEEFTDTGWDIGLDEGYDDRENQKTALGPGNSIDQVFSVWRKDCPEATTVKLKPTRPEDLDVDPRTVEICMYGIVATELVESPHL